MTEFNYDGIGGAGKKERGVLQAQTAEEARRMLQAKGITIIKLSNKKRKKGGLMAIGTISFVEKMIFLQQIQAMMEAGLALHEAVDFLKDDTENPVFKNAIETISETIKEGKTFGAALERFPKVFPPLTTNLIKAGEASGTLPTVLKAITTYMEKQAGLRRKIWGALTYPIIVLGVAVLMGIGIFGFLMPRLLQIFSSLNLKLPPLTKALIASYEFMRSYWLFVIGGAILGIIGLIMLAKAETTKRKFHLLWLSLPMIKHISKLMNLVQGTRSLSILLQTGIPLNRAFEITKETVGNVLYREALQETQKNIAEGKTIAVSLEKYPKLFPHMMRQMIYVGEKSGNLPDVCGHLEHLYEQELDHKLQKLTNMIEPLMLIVVSFGVGLLAIAVIVPIYQLPSLLKR